MKALLLFTVIIGFSFFGHSQSFEFWNSIGAKYKIGKRLTVAGSFTDRINNRGVKAFFPELTSKLKITKWAVCLLIIVMSLKKKTMVTTSALIDLTLMHVSRILINGLNTVVGFDTK